MQSLARLDRRVIYIFVALALSLPLIYRYSVPPARMKAAEKLYAEVDKLDPQSGKIAFVALDFGPSSKAENEAQAQVVVEHLMRRRIPIAFFSLYYLAESFLKGVPERVADKLTREHPGQVWEYGKDWVNLGYRPGAAILIQSIPKSDNLAELFAKDVRGNDLTGLPLFKNVRTINDISFLAEFTGLVGVFNTYVQFFQSQDYRPRFGHGCTSITIPEAFIYVDSGQLDGLLEGIAGAAWYSKLLSDKYPARVKDDSELINTGLGIAHLVVIFFVILGNISARWGKRL